MIFIPLDSLQVPLNRQRQEFDEDGISDLARSIGEIGLLHPLVVRRTGPTSAELVAGERRLRALHRCNLLGRQVQHAGVTIPPGTAPCTPIGDLSEAERYQVELEENVTRTDLTWQEKAGAIRRLGELKLAANPDAEVSKEIAQDIYHRAASGYYGDRVHKALVVAQHLDNPDVAGAATLQDAYKVLKRQEDRSTAAAFAAADSRPESEKHLIVHADAVEFCESYNGPLFDVLLTDPPYGMNADEFGDSGGVAQGAHTYDDSPENFLALMQAWIPAVSRILSPNCHVYQFCDFEHFHHLRQLWELAGLRVFRTPLVWFKPSNYRAPWPSQGPQRKYELILYGVHGEKLTRRLGGDVIQMEQDNDAAHNARKPIGLYKELLTRSCLPGELVLDCFAGSGPLIPAAQSVGVRSCSVERDSAAYGMCLQRLQTLAEEA